MKIKSNPSLTILTIVFGLLILNLFLDKQVIIYLCVVLSGVSVFSIEVARMLEKIWFKASFILSQIIPNILLSIIFFLVLTPLALLSKLFKSKTEFTSRNDHDTIFKTQNKVFDQGSFEKAW